MQTDNQQQEDHDLIIALSVKVESVLEAIKELKNGLYLQITDHEKRIKQVEDMVLKENLTNIRNDVDKLNGDWGGFRASLRIYMIIAGAIGAFVVWIGQQTIVKIFFR